MNDDIPAEIPNEKASVLPEEISPEASTEIPENKTEIESAITPEPENLSPGINSTETETPNIPDVIKEEVEEEEKEISVDQSLLDIERVFLGEAAQRQAEIIANRAIYSQDVRGLAQMVSMLSTVILSLAEELEVKTPIQNFCQETGQFVPILLKVQKEKAYNLQMLGYISILVKKSLDRKINEASESINKTKKLEYTIEDLRSSIDLKNKTINQLQNSLRHPTIDKKSFVLAYLNDKGYFTYFGVVDGVERKVFNFSMAEKFDTEVAAMTKLVYLLKNFSHGVIGAHKMQVYNASLVFAESNNDHGLIAIRDNYKTYESENKAKAKTKVKKKKVNFDFSQAFTSKSTKKIKKVKPTKFKFSMK